MMETTMDDGAGTVDENGMPVDWTLEHKKSVADSGIRYLKARLAECPCGSRSCPSCQERRGYIERYQNVLATSE
jgi:hypothetical protein